MDQDQSIKKAGVAVPFWDFDHTGIFADGRPDHIGLPFTNLPCEDLL